jgi:hypothetical protein
MKAPESNEFKRHRELARHLPLRATMRPTLHRRACALLRNVTLAADCLVTAMFERDDVMVCCVQIAVNGAPGPVLVAPTSELIFDRRIRRASESGSLAL